MQEIAASSTEIRVTISQRVAAEGGGEKAGLTLLVTDPIGVVLIIPSRVSRTMGLHR